MTTTAGAPARPAVASTVRRVAALFSPYRAQVAVVGLAILVTSGLGVVNPFLIRAVFDRALFVPGGPRLGLLWALVAAMIAIPVVSGAIAIGQTFLANRMGQRVMEDLRATLYTHLQRMSLRFFTATRTGEIQSRLANDVGGVQSVVTDTAASILANVVIVLSTLVAMVLMSWQLTLLSLCLFPVFVLFTYRVGRRRREVAASTQESKAEMSAITQETLSVSGILLAKVFDRQADEIGRFQRENRRLADLQVRQEMIGRVFFSLVQSFFSITPALVYLVAGLVGPGGRITAGTLVAFTTLQTRLFFPIGQLLQVSVEVQSSLALFQRVFEYLDLPRDIVDTPTARPLGQHDVRGEIRLRHVSFRYEAGAAADGDGARPGRRWALEDLSLEIEPGRLAAIVGPSGAGKTTISYLVPRLYDVTEGSVEIDGTDVREIQLSSLSEIVGMVTQESYLFHASVRGNLLYGRPDATEEEIEAAARAALIHDRVLELADGYDTVVGERGYRLSGGEKQRLAIARVILKDPRILILDEATSALDTTSERLVQAALQPLMAGRTTIAIAHRLSTILAADVIFVLDRGRLVEQGTHAELVERGGLYARLYAEQYQSGLVEARCQDGLVLSSGQVLTTG
ncbi:MAG TPA: ABC transporter ATP-binding protein [Actinomycetota bacterium]|nr:ABC transporter ATP-binding protein [Actinomycetota bacterium]